MGDSAIPPVQVKATNLPESGAEVLSVEGVPEGAAVLTASIESALPAPVHRRNRLLRAIFHWKYSGVFIPFCWGAVMACVGIATALDRYEFFFRWAYFFAVCGLIWTLGYWLTSDTLEKMRKLMKQKIVRVGRVSISRYELLRWGGCIVVVLVFVGSLCFINGAEVRKSLQSYTGYLVPGHEATPPNSCDWIRSIPMPTGGAGYPKYLIPPDSLSVLLGPMTAISSEFPSIIITIDGETILIMDKDSDGRVTITTAIYDENQNIIATLEKNVYLVDSSVFKLARDSVSDLGVVVRHNKEEVLHVHYFNSRTIAITGVFRTKNAVLRVDDDLVTLNGKPIMPQHICSGNNSFPDFRFQSN